MGVASATSTRRFGKYSLVAKLATGGMAEIFLARLQGAAGFEKLVCIKRILPHLAKDQQLVGMFLAEARIAAQISHPNVCQVFELGDIDGSYFIAMEYLEGVPLSCFRRRDLYPAQPDPRLVAGLGVQACEGLHHAHQLKRADGSPLEVVHRDISSNNLFATVDGVVKVLDFGIAKVQDATVRTSTGSVKGTYAYMAPEQLRGEAIDRRTDVFAMGIVLWELFARRHLFKRETDYLTFQAITSDPIPDLGELRPDVPPALAATIAQALARDKELRFPTARALGAALAQAVAPLGGPLSAPQLSDEIARAFEVRLRDQQGLIRIAREGGALDLAEDLGPGVGHGTAMVTTPVSIVSAHGATTTVDPKLAPASPGPRSITLPVPPLPLAPERRSRLVIGLLVVVALASAAAAVVFYVRAAASGSPPDGPKLAGITADASAAPPAIAIDAAIAHDRGIAVIDARTGAAVGAAALDAAPRDEPPIDTVGAPEEPRARSARIDATTEVAVDAARATELDAGVPTRPDTPPRTAGRPDAPGRPTDPRPSGPPGFITIDSSPVYAVIYIDGKQYGETPLVRIQLAPGRHAVRAVSASGTIRNLSIAIEPGKVAPTRRIEW